VFAADPTVPGGWIKGHWIQFAYQLCNSVVGLAYSFVMTMLILFVMRISGLALRVSENAEKRGIDESEIGYHAYDFAVYEPEEGSDTESTHSSIDMEG